ncbi:hypothetical protein Tco_0898270 [Tanacetum coccineum]
MMMMAWIMLDDGVVAVAAADGEGRTARGGGECIEWLVQIGSRGAFLESPEKSRRKSFPGVWLARIAGVDVTMLVGEKQEQSAKEREVDTSVEYSAAPTTIEEITLAQTLIQIKAAKPKVITNAATTTTTTRPKARGVVVQEPSKFQTPQESQPSMIKEKGKAIMIEYELETELIEEERLGSKKEEEANIALIESWDNTQAMIEADFELAQRLQTEEQGEITIEERSRLFVELMNKRKKHFAMTLRLKRKRKAPTKATKEGI